MRQNHPTNRRIFLLFHGSLCMSITWLQPCSPWLTFPSASQFSRLTCGALRQQLSSAWLLSSQLPLHLRRLCLLLTPGTVQEDSSGSLSSLNAGSISWMHGLVWDGWETQTTAIWIQCLWAAMKEHSVRGYSFYKENTRKNIMYPAGFQISYAGIWNSESNQAVETWGLELNWLKLPGNYTSHSNMFLWELPSWQLFHIS